MSHHTAKESYKRLEERLNRFPQGAPPSETLYKILSILFSEKEAALVAQLPIKSFTSKQAARIWKMDEAAAHNILHALASRAILLDVEDNGEQRYMLPPPMAGFLEFSMMRTRGDVDQKLLAELIHQYLNVEEDFIKDLFWGCDTKLGRVFVQEEVLTNDNSIHVLNYERSSHVIESAKHIGISMCYCRHKAQHIGEACNAPMDICMTFDNVAASLVKHGYAREVDASEGIELLHEAYENNLVQCGENVREGVTFICNCCGCCCEALVAAKKFGILQPVHTTNFIPKVQEKCVGCGKCAKACPISAISIVSESVKSVISQQAAADNVSDIASTLENSRKIAKINEDICLGCGVCVRSCHNKSIKLESRKERIITPANSVHRAVLMAIEKGQLQNLIFDNQAFRSHRAMAAILSAILKLPPMKQIMASKQMKSVYLEKLLAKVKV